MPTCNSTPGKLEACSPAPDNGRKEKALKLLQLFDDPFINFLISQKIEIVSHSFMGGSKKHWFDRYGYKYQYAIEYAGGGPIGFADGKYYFNTKNDTIENHKKAGF